MIVLIFLILFTLVAIYGGKFVRKHSIKLYLGASVISIIAFIFKNIPIFKPFIQGFLGLSFFYLVMVTGGLPKKSKLRIKLMGVRREFSIIGFIVVTPHALEYIIQGLDGTKAIAWYGLIAFILMIPLFITSFSVIRKKMSIKTWRLIQSPAYIIYALLLIHLIKNYTKIINLILYLVLFSFYIVSKLIFEIQQYKIKRVKINPVK